MSSLYFLQNSKEALVDSPFAKMASFFSAASNQLGIPPIPINSDFKPNELHRRAAEVLELTDRDAGFVAARIRHLDFIARYSSLSSAMTWRSSLKDTTEYGKEFDKNIGFFAISNNPSVSLSGIKTISSLGNRTSWNYSLTTEDNSNTFLLTDSFEGARLVSVLIGSVGLIPLSNSGYILRLANNMAGGETMSGTITVTAPYSGNILPVKQNILANNDLLIQITNNKPELMQYFQQESLPEDVVAAFLLAIDSI